MTLEEIIERANCTYTRNNRIYIPSLSGLVSMLSISIGKARDTVRAELSKKLIGKSLAHVVSWTFAIVNHFKDMPFAEAMCKKYPTKCGYCGNPHCHCPDAARKKHRKGRVQSVRLKWSLRDHQDNLRELYAQRNEEEEKGVDYIFNRLFQEVVELMQNLAGDCVGEDANEIEEAYALELADILAWTIALANYFKIDLERSLSIWYGKGCAECRRMPCKCRRFMVSHKRIHNVFVRSLDSGGTRP